jgi:hypothetical protein
MPERDAHEPRGAVSEEASFLRLDPECIFTTIERLCQRIEFRFPGSGLGGVGRQLLGVAGRARERAAWFSRPILGLRIAAYGLAVLIVVGLALTLLKVRVPNEPFVLLDFVQALESGINDVVFVAAAVFFLVTAENRIKRHRALAAINELRAIAHIIDMHQLTKDPEWVLPRGRESGVLPPRRLTAFELSRYLDYCSEMLSLTGKVAALYIQSFDDAVALSAVNEVEDLTTGLSRKVWQKLMILHAAQPGASSRGARSPA